MIVYSLEPTKIVTMIPVQGRRRPTFGLAVVDQAMREPLAHPLLVYLVGRHLAELERAAACHLQLRGS